MAVLADEHKVPVAGAGNDIHPVGVFQHIVFGIFRTVGQAHMVATRGEPGATDEVFGVEDGPGLGILFHGG